MARLGLWVSDKMGLGPRAEPKSAPLHVPARGIGSTGRDVQGADCSFAPGPGLMRPPPHNRSPCLAPPTYPLPDDTPKPPMTPSHQPSQVHPAGGSPRLSSMETMPAPPSALSSIPSGGCKVDEPGCLASMTRSRGSGDTDSSSRAHGTYYQGCQEAKPNYHAAPAPLHTWGWWDWPYSP